MKKYISALLLILLATPAFADTHAAADCAVATVQAVHDDAGTTAGDIITIPAGSCTWTSSLAITKNIHLKGNGATGGSKTELTANGVPLITYAPTTPSATVTFELSAISMVMQGAADFAVTFAHTSTTVMQQIKVHDLVITSTNMAFEFEGLYKGAIYSNTITTANQIQQNVGPSDGGIAAWNAIEKCSGSPLSCTHDDGNNLYWEDNVLTAGSMVLESGGAGFSYVLRYNTVVKTDGTQGFEWHGNYPMPNNRCSSMDMAVYANHWNTSSSVVGGGFGTLRGGMGMVFYNYLTQSSDFGFTLQAEYATPIGACTDTTNPQPQKISDTYIWATVSAADLLPDSYDVADVPNEITENTDYFLQKVGSFDGTGSAGGGVGCGTLPNRPATCTTGVGYWATAQSCTDIAALTGAVGRSGGRATSATALAGTFYKCTATNTWTAYYTPYTYPHPLRTDEADTTPPTVSSVTISTNGTDLVIAFSESITATDDAAFTITPSGSAATVDCPAVASATNTMTCVISRTIQYDESATYGYTGTKVKDSSDNNLAEISNTPSVVNNSTVGQVTTRPHMGCIFGGGIFH